MTSSHWILTLVCEDRPGIVHAISGAIVEAGGNITESQQFSSDDTGTFFMRLQVESAAVARGVRGGPRAGRRALRHDVAARRRRPPAAHPRAGSTAAHCLNDLLFRQRAGQLPVEIPLVLGNHPDLGELAAFYGVPFEALPVTDAEQKAAFEARVLEAVERARHRAGGARAVHADPLAPSCARALAGRVINIHHSFLPGFKGANPYKQAHARGVKLIGATAHFVTSDLDEGPIIEQNIVRVDHTAHRPSSSRSVRTRSPAPSPRPSSWFAEDRVLLDGARTIIFR